MSRNDGMFMKTLCVKRLKKGRVVEPLARLHACTPHVACLHVCGKRVWPTMNAQRPTPHFSVDGCALGMRIDILQSLQAAALTFRHKDFSPNSFCATRQALYRMDRLFSLSLKKGQVMAVDQAKPSEVDPGFLRQRCTQLPVCPRDGAKQAFYFDASVTLGGSMVLRKRLSISPWHHRHGVLNTERQIGDASHEIRSLTILPVLSPSPRGLAVQQVNRTAQNTLMVFLVISVIQGLDMEQKNMPASCQEKKKASTQVTSQDIELYILPVVMMIERNLSYMKLPQNIATIADDPLYQFGLPVGRYQYGLYLHDVGEDGHVHYNPELLELQEVLDIVDAIIRPSDRRLAVSLPLAYRVGCVVGFLSGLRVSQRSIAYSALIILAALVTPLLISSSRNRAN